MTDEAFHLTALDVRRYDFGNALRGYDRARVDQFRDQVAEELERLSRANQDLDQKARNFHEQLKSFRERDKALNDALVSAQQLRGEIREQAEREAALIVREARASADAALQQIRDDVRRADEELQQLWRARRSYITQVRHLVERQLGELRAAEEETPPPFMHGRESMVDGSDSAPPAAGRSTASTGASAATSVSRDTQPLLDELRDLPPRPASPTPSWLDVVDD